MDEIVFFCFDDLLMKNGCATLLQRIKKESRKRVFVSDILGALKTSLILSSSTIFQSPKKLSGVPKIIAQFWSRRKGTFNNYVDKKRWVGGQQSVHAWSREQKVGIMSTFVHSRGVGRQNLVHVHSFECPLRKRLLLLLQEESKNDI